MNFLVCRKYNEWKNNMNIKNITYMSIYNLAHKKKQNIFIISMLVILEMIMFCVLLFQNILLENIYSISTENISQCFVSCSGEMLSEKEISVQEFLDDMKLQDKVEDICVYDYDYFGELYDVNFKNILFEIDGGKYIRNAKYKMDDDNTIYLQVVKYDYLYPLFSWTECEENREKNNKGIYLYGGDFTDVNQVVLAENLLRKYDIPQEKWETLIGKRLNVLYQEINSEEEKNMSCNEKLYEQLEIRGIIRKEALLINAKEMMDSYMYVSSESKDMQADSVNIRFYAKKYSDLKEIKDYIEKVSGIVTILPEMASVYEYVQQIYDEAVEYGNVIFKMAMVIVISFFILVLQFEFRHRKRYYTMLRALGGTNITIQILVLLENFFPTIIALLVSVMGNELLKKVMEEGIRQSHILQLSDGNMNFVKCTLASEGLLLGVVVFVVLGISMVFCRKYVYMGFKGE